MRGLFLNRRSISLLLVLVLVFSFVQVFIPVPTMISYGAVSGADEDLQLLDANYMSEFMGLGIPNNQAVIQGKSLDGSKTYVFRPHTVSWMKRSGDGDNYFQMWSVEYDGKKGLVYCLTPGIYGGYESGGNQFAGKGLSVSDSYMITTASYLLGPQSGIGSVYSGEFWNVKETSTNWYNPEVNNYSTRADMYEWDKLKDGSWGINPTTTDVSGSKTIVEQGAQYVVMQSAIKKIIGWRDNMGGPSDWGYLGTQNVGPKYFVQAMSNWGWETNYVLAAGNYINWLIGEKQLTHSQIVELLTPVVSPGAVPSYTQDRSTGLITPSSVGTATVQASGVNLTADPGGLAAAGNGSGSYTVIGPFSAASNAIERRLEIGWDFGEERNKEKWASSVTTTGENTGVPDVQNGYWIIDEQDVLLALKAANPGKESEIDALSFSDGVAFLSGSQTEYHYNGTPFSASDKYNVDLDPSKPWNGSASTFISNGFSPAMGSTKRNHLDGVTNGKSGENTRTFYGDDTKAGGGSSAFYTSYPYLEKNFGDGQFYMMLPDSWYSTINGAGLQLPAVKVGVRFPGKNYIYIGKGTTGEGNDFTIQNMYNGLYYQLHLKNVETLGYTQASVSPPPPPGGLKVKKYDDKGNPLPGADFQLIPFVTGGLDGGVFDETKAIASNHDDDHTFSWDISGLEGMFIINEHKVPDGYSRSGILATLDVDSYENFRDNQSFFNLPDYQDYLATTWQEAFDMGAAPFGRMSAQTNQMIHQFALLEGEEEQQQSQIITQVNTDSYTGDSTMRFNEQEGKAYIMMGDQDLLASDPAIVKPQYNSDEMVLRAEIEASGTTDKDLQDFLIGASLQEKVRTELVAELEQEAEMIKGEAATGGKGRAAIPGATTYKFYAPGTATYVLELPSAAATSLFGTKSVFSSNKELFDHVKGSTVRYTGGVTINGTNTVLGGSGMLPSTVTSGTEVTLVSTSSGYALSIPAGLSGAEYNNAAVVLLLPCNSISIYEVMAMNESGATAFDAAANLSLNGVSITLTPSMFGTTVYYVNPPANITASTTSGAVVYVNNPPHPSDLIAKGSSVTFSVVANNTKEYIVYGPKTTVLAKVFETPTGAALNGKSLLSQLSVSNATYTISSGGSGTIQNGVLRADSSKTSPSDVYMPDLSGGRLYGVKTMYAGGVKGESDVCMVDLTSTGIVAGSEYSYYFIDKSVNSLAFNLFTDTPSGAGRDILSPDDKQGLSLATGSGTIGLMVTGPSFSKTLSKNGNKIFGEFDFFSAAQSGEYKFKLTAPHAFNFDVYVNGSKVTSGSTGTEVSVNLSGAAKVVFLITGTIDESTDVENIPEDMRNTPSSSLKIRVFEDVNMNGTYEDGIDNKIDWFSLQLCLETRANTVMTVVNSKGQFGSDSTALPSLTDRSKFPVMDTSGTWEFNLNNLYAGDYYVLLVESYGSGNRNDGLAQAGGYLADDYIYRGSLSQYFNPMVSYMYRSGYHVFKQPIVGATTIDLPLVKTTSLGLVEQRYTGVSKYKGTGIAGDGATLSVGAGQEVKNTETTWAEYFNADDDMPVENVEFEVTSSAGTSMYKGRPFAFGSSGSQVTFLGFDWGTKASPKEYLVKARALDYNLTFIDGMDAATWMQSYTMKSWIAPTPYTFRVTGTGTAQVRVNPKYQGGGDNVMGLQHFVKVDTSQLSEAGAEGSITDGIQGEVGISISTFVDRNKNSIKDPSEIKVLSGVVYRLKDSEGVVIGEKTSPDIAKWTNLQPGTYTIEIVTIPAGYELVPSTGSIQGGACSFASTTLTVLVDGGRFVTLNAGFVDPEDVVITEDSPGLVNPSLVGDVIFIHTNENGEKVVEGIDLERIGPDTYKAINKSETPIVIKKVDEKGQPLPGDAEFKISKSKDQGASGETLAKIDTGNPAENGVYHRVEAGGNNPIGQWYITETKAPNPQYKIRSAQKDMPFNFAANQVLDYPKDVTVKKETVNIEGVPTECIVLEVINKKTITIRLEKYWETPWDDSGSIDARDINNRLGGAGFILQRNVGGNWEYVDYEVPVTWTDPITGETVTFNENAAGITVNTSIMALGQARFIRYTYDDAGHLLHGVVAWPELDPGNYRVLEVSSGAYYYYGATPGTPDSEVYGTVYIPWMPASDNGQIIVNGTTGEEVYKIEMTNTIDWGNVFTMRKDWLTSSGMLITPYPSGVSANFRLTYWGYDEGHTTVYSIPPFGGNNYIDFTIDTANQVFTIGGQDLNGDGKMDENDWLPDGIYQIQEISATTGYLVDPKFEGEGQFFTMFHDRTLRWSTQNILVQSNRNSKLEYTPSGTQVTGKAQNRQDSSGTVHLLKEFKNTGGGTYSWSQLKEVAPDYVDSLEFVLVPDGGTLGQDGIVGVPVAIDWNSTEPAILRFDFAISEGRYALHEVIGGSYSSATFIGERDLYDSDNGNFMIIANQTIVNELAVEIKLIARKTDMSGNTIPGVTVPVDTRTAFQLYYRATEPADKHSLDGFSPVGGVKWTGVTGEVSWDTTAYNEINRVGWYTIREITPPTGYTLNSSPLVNEASGLIDGAIFIDPETGTDDEGVALAPVFVYLCANSPIQPKIGKITVYKHEIGNLSKSVLAHFTLRNASNEVVGTVNTPTVGGTVSWSGLSLGVYTLEETWVEAAYVLPALPAHRTTTITLTEGSPGVVYNAIDDVYEWDGNIANAPLTGSLNLLKVAQDIYDPTTYTAKSGVSITLYSDVNGNGTFEAGIDTVATGAVPSANQVTGLSGTVSWSGLPDGKYLAVETAVPSEYLGPPAVAAMELVLGEPSQTLYTMSNDLKPLELTIVKKETYIDEYGVTQTRVLTASDMIGAEYVEFTVFDAVSGLPVSAPQRIDATGKVVFPGLWLRKAYVVKETHVPEGWISGFPTEGYSLQLLPTTPGVTEEPLTFKYSVDCTNARIPGSIRLTKYKNNEPSMVGGNPYLAGAGFTLHIYRGAKSNPDWIVDRADFAVYRNEVFTNDIGEYTWTNLPWGIYYLEETTVPNGYKEVPDYTLVTIGSRTSTAVREVTRQNQTLGSVVIVKYKDETGTDVLGAGFGFTLYKYNQAGEPTDKLNSAHWTEVTPGQKTTDTFGEVYWNNLEYGYYYAKETNVPSGFLNKAPWTGETPIFDIGTTKLLQVFTAYNYKPVLGEVTIKKLDGPEGVGAAVYGAGFTLKMRSGLPGFYTWNDVDLDNSGTPDPERFTNSGNNSTLTWSNIPVGVYRIVETTIPTTHVSDGTTYYEFEVKGGFTNTFSYVFINTPLVYGGVRLIKTDSVSGLPLGGATFGVYYESVNDGMPNALTQVPGTQLKVTEPNGVVNWTEAELGSLFSLQGTQLYIVETAAPEGYLMPVRPVGWETSASTWVAAYGVHPVKVNSNLAFSTVTATNTLPGKITLIKTYDSGKKFDALYKAQFALFSSQNDSSEIAGTRQWTDNNGEIRWTGLKTNTTYYYKEVALNYAAGVKFEIDSNFYPVTLTDSNYEVTVTKENIRLPSVEIEIVKVSGTDSSVIGGAVFALYNSAQQELDRKTTDSSGRITWTELDRAVYYVKEISVPEPYTLPSPNNMITLDFTVLPSTETKITKVITNTIQLASVTVYKRDGNTMEYLNGAVIALYDSLGVEISRKTTGSDGTPGLVRWTGLAKGLYYVAEVKAPAGYPEPTTPTKYPADVRTGMPVNCVIDAIYNYKNVGLTVIKKDGDTNVRLSGAAIGLFNSQYVEIDRKITDANGTVYWSDLQPGTYFVRELSPPVGYELINEWKVVQLTQGQTSGTVEIVNYRRGNIHIIKTDESGVVRLPGAVFELRQAGQRIAESTTDSAGMVRFSNLPAGLYEVYEIKAPDGYVASAEVLQVVLGQSMYGTGVWNHEYTVRNLKENGRLIIHKVDEDGLSLEGAQFKITSFNGTTWTEWVDSNGMLVLDNLRYGTYQIEEVVAPEGYIAEAEVRYANVTQQTPVVTLEVVNYPEELELEEEITPMSIALNKLADTGEALPGATFHLMDSSGEVVQEIISDNNGFAVFRDLEPGDYTFQEVESPSGFVLDLSTYKVSNGERRSWTFSLVNDHKTVEFSFNKIDEETGEPLANAEFSINAIGGQTIGNYVTDESGTFKVILPVGQYEVYENAAPSGYSRLVESTALVVTDEHGDFESMDITNRWTPISFQVFKYDLGNGYSLSGAEFAVYSEDGSVEIDRGFTDSNGLLGFLLPEGKYMYREVNPPRGYGADTNVYYPLEITATIGRRVEVPNSLIDINPEPLPRTGLFEGKSGVWFAVALTVLVAGAGAGTIVIIRRRKRT